MDKKKIIAYAPVAAAIVIALAALAFSSKSTRGLKMEITRLNGALATANEMIKAQADAIEGYKKSIEGHQKIIKDLAAERDNLILHPGGTQPAAAAEPTPQAAAKAAQNAAVEEALEPKEVAANDFNTKMDELKKNYEEMLVTYFLLKKCKVADDTQYHVIVSALSQEMASLDAPGRMQYDILTSAEGSYKELYSNTPCTDPSIEPLKQQFDNFIASISKSFTPDNDPTQEKAPEKTN